MKRTRRPHYLDSQKALMWQRWRQGDSLQEIARLCGRVLLAGITPYPGVPLIKALCAGGRWDSVQITEVGLAARRHSRVCLRRAACSQCAQCQQPLLGERYKSSKLR